MGTEPGQEATPGNGSGTTGDPDNAGGQRRCNLSERQVQRKFKHAVKFGVVGPYNSANAERWKAAIVRFVHDPETLVLRGTYTRGADRGGFAADFYYRPGSRLVIVVDSEGEFVTGFRMSLQQQAALLRTGRLGGGA